jgi:hypothetical protein
VPAFGQSQLTVTNGQSVTAGPGTPVGANFSNIIVNTSGNLTGTNLTVQNANFNGSTRILLTGPATASLTNTAIALQNSTTGISAAGPNALLTLAVHSILLTLVASATGLESLPPVAHKLTSRKDLLYRWILVVAAT